MFMGVFMCALVRIHYTFIWGEWGNWKLGEWGDGLLNGLIGGEREYRQFGY